MAVDDESREHGLKNQSLGNPDGVRSYYDGWTKSYERDVLSWGYDAPSVAVEFLSSGVRKEERILDAGCGTGLVGKALSAKGYRDVVGVDLSPESLDRAADTHYYSELAEADLTKVPTNLEASSFSAVLAVGVLSYLTNLEEVLREFIRVAVPGGTIIVTERTDLFVERNTGEAFEALQSQGLWRIVTVTEPRSYLPGHPEFAEIDVHFGVFERE